MEIRQSYNSLENKVYVVTGATSFIASGLLRKLVAEEKTVYAICRLGSSNMYRIPESEFIHIIYCDLSELARVTEQIKQECQVFFHLGWSTTEKNDMYLQNLNIKYTLDAVHLSKQLGCHTFVGTGSQAEYGLANVKLTDKTPTFPVTGYGMAKLCAGQMSRKLCEDLGIIHIWARILSVYGPMDSPNTLIMSLIKKLKQGIAVNLTGCEQIWDYMYIDDCAEALYLLSQKGARSNIYVVGSGEPKLLQEYVDVVKNTVNCKGVLNIGNIPYGESTPMYLFGDITKLRNIGFKCCIDFEVGVKILNAE